MRFYIARTRALFGEAIFYLFSLRLTFKRWRARAILVPMPRAPNNYIEPP